MLIITVMLCCSNCSGPDLSADDSEEAEKVGLIYFHFMAMHMQFHKTFALRKVN